MTAEHADAFAQLDVPARLRVGGRGLTPDPGALRADRMVSDGQDGHGCPLPEKPTLAAIPIAPGYSRSSGPFPGRPPPADRRPGHAGGVSDRVLTLVAGVIRARRRRSATSATHLHELARTPYGATSWPQDRTRSGALSLSLETSARPEAST
jgi:hypothetical protein